MSEQTINVILVDDNDKTIGYCEKLDAHISGQLHRAISVFLTTTGTLEMRPDNLVLLQQRASVKYHSPLLWSNAACTHPLDTETPEEATRRALKVELGLKVDNLSYQGHFIYKTPVTSYGPDGKIREELFEHEFDHVFIGKLDKNQLIPFNLNEVAQTQWVPIPELYKHVHDNPQQFTHWLPYLLDFLKSSETRIDYRKTNS